MLDAQAWMADYTRRVRALFGDRVRFVGLQGSYGRGEADEDSDIDPVVILDAWSMADAAAYRGMLADMPTSAEVCGFAGGAEELRCGDGADMFQFVRDTTAWFGDLADLAPQTGFAEAERAAHRGACDLYHALVHHSVHGDNPRLLPALLKNAVYVMQALTYVRTGKYARTRAALRTLASPEEQEILHLAGTWCHQAITAEDETNVAPVLLTWLQGVIRGGGAGSPT